MKIGLPPAPLPAKGVTVDRYAPCCTLQPAADGPAPDQGVFSIILSDRMFENTP